MAHSLVSKAILALCFVFSESISASDKYTHTKKKIRAKAAFYTSSLFAGDDKQQETLLDSGQVAANSVQRSGVTLILQQYCKQFGTTVHTPAVVTKQCTQKLQRETRHTQKPTPGRKHSLLKPPPRCQVRTVLSILDPNITQNDRTTLQKSATQNNIAGGSVYSGRVRVCVCVCAGVRARARVCVCVC